MHRGVRHINSAVEDVKARVCDACGCAVTMTAWPATEHELNRDIASRIDVISIFTSEGDLREFEHQGQNSRNLVDSAIINSTQNSTSLLLTTTLKCLDMFWEYRTLRLRVSAAPTRHRVYCSPLPYRLQNHPSSSLRRTICWLCPSSFKPYVSSSHHRFL